MRSLLSIAKGVGLGFAVIGGLSLIFDGWMLLAAAFLLIGVVLIAVAFLGIDRWKRAGAERSDRTLAAASELMLARIDAAYPIQVRRPRGWVRLAVTVRPLNDPPYATTLAELLNPGAELPAKGAVIVVARGERERPDVRWIRHPDAAWQRFAAEQSLATQFPRWGSVRTRASWDSRLASEEQWRSWQSALTVACGALGFVVGAVVVGPL